MSTFYNKVPVLSTDVSSELSLLAFSNKSACLKQINSAASSPFSYAIGFGNKSNASLIVGGEDDGDSFSTQLLIAFVENLSEALSRDGLLFGINIKKIFSYNGLWVVPSLKSHPPDFQVHNFILNELRPKRLLEIRLCGETIRYSFGKRPAPNSKLMAYLLASSCGYHIDKRNIFLDNNLCSWFASEFSGPAFSMSVGRELDLTPSDVEPLLARLFECLALFIAA